MKVLLSSLLLLFSNLAFAQKAKIDAVAVELALGKPTMELTNPDSSVAYYSGISASAKGVIPLYAGGALALNLTASVKNLDVKNTSLSSVVESSQMIGPGVGLEISTGSLVAGYDFFSMRVRHQTTGSLASFIEYNLSTTGYYVGLLKTSNQLSVGFLYNQTNGTIPMSDTGFSSPVPFKDEVYWLVFRYNMGMSFGALLKAL